MVSYVSCQGDVFNRGDDPGEMGSGLPAISLGTGVTVVALASGLDFNCVLLDNGGVKVKGEGGLSGLSRRGASL